MPVRWGLCAAMGAIVWSCATSAAAAPCGREVHVVGAEATFRTHTVQGRPVRRDASIEVTVRSTATTAISAVELAVFLGARLEDIDRTRPQALPTRRPRLFPSGGLAFRTEVDTLLPPGAKRVLSVRQTGLPLDRDVYRVTAQVVRCRRLVSVGTATIDLPPREDPWLVWLYVGGMSLAAIAGAMVIGRLR